MYFNNYFDMSLSCFETFSIKEYKLEFCNYKCVNEIIVYLRRIMLINCEVVMQSCCRIVKRPSAYVDSRS